jgi:hypothetical protein
MRGLTHADVRSPGAGPATDDVAIVTTGQLNGLGIHGDALALRHVAAVLDMEARLAAASLRRLPSSACRVL